MLHDSIVRRCQDTGQGKTIVFYQGLSQAKSIKAIAIPAISNTNSGKRVHTEVAADALLRLLSNIQGPESVVI